MKKAGRNWIALVLVLALAFVTFGCSPATDSDDTGSSAPAGDSGTAAPQGGQAQEPSDGEELRELHVGFLVPDTGSQATMGPLGRAAYEIAFERYNNGEVAGRKVIVHIEDTASDAAIGVQKAQKLIEEYGCEIVLGPLSGSVATAVKEYAGTQPETTFIMNGGGDTMTYGVIYDNVFRTAIAGSQAGFSLGEYAARHYKKVLTVAPDNDFQYSLIAGFKYTFIRAGGEVESIWFPESGTDYSSMIAQIPDDIDAILCAAFGGLSADFLKQLREYGHTDIPLMSTHSAMDPASVSNPEVGQYFEGCVTTTHTPNTLTGEYFEWFNERHIEKVGFSTSIMTMDPYCAFIVLFEGLEKVNGNTEDLEAFRAALSALEFDTPVGVRYFDENRQIVVTEYLVQCTWYDEYNTYMSKILEEYPNQTQFGPFDPDWYSAQELPSRTNPTIETIMSAKLAGE